MTMTYRSNTLKKSIGGIICHLTLTAATFVVIPQKRFRQPRAPTIGRNSPYSFEMAAKTERQPIMNDKSDKHIEHDEASASNMTSEKKSDLTIFLDLDQTLVCSLPYEMIDNVPSEYRAAFESFMIELLDEHGHSHKVRVHKRPHLDHFLEKLSERFAEIHLFTSATKDYADKVVDKLDPRGTIFAQRWYRDSLTNLESPLTETWRKNVLKLGIGEKHEEDGTKAKRINPKRFVLIDDDTGYMLDHLSNGLAVKDFSVGLNIWGEFEKPIRNDTCLLDVLNMLEVLDEADDVRPVVENMDKIARMTAQLAFLESVEAHL